MVWTNWQGAIWRGAILVILFWSGLAWTQTPAPRPADPTERIMAVHENGKTRRCRVLETWQLPDGRVAHLLQVLDTGEKITIADDQAPTGTQPSNLPDRPRAMPKRIFSWGLGRNTPPEGSPIPPHYRLEMLASTSGLVVQESGPVIVNRNESPLSNGPRIGASVIQQTGSTPTVGGAPSIIQAANPPDNGGPKTIDAVNPIPSLEPPLLLPSPATTPTVPLPSLTVEAFPAIPSAGTPGTPSINPPVGNPSVAPAAPATINAAPLPSVVSVVGPNPVCATMPMEPYVRSPWRPGDRIAEWFQSRSSVTTVQTEMVVPGTTTGPLVGEPRIVYEPEPAATQPWRPGQKVWQWFTGKSSTEVVHTEPLNWTDSKRADTKPVEPLKLETKPAELKVTDVKLEEPKKGDKTEAIIKLPDTPFSTAMPTPIIPEPELKKVDPAPLALPTPAGSSTPPKEAAPLLLPTTSPTPGEVKPAGGPPVEKHDLWGTPSGSSIVPPGKAPLEGSAKSAEVAQLPPPSLVRNNDPLMMPERLNPGEDRMKPSMMAPPLHDEVYPPPIPGPMSSNNWPLGSQSVLAARNGLQGPVTYVPVPIVTQPAPNRAPAPPMPTGLEAPQLNAYVNAFSPPPQPKGMQQYPAQGMMPPYANPMFAQQMMQQQMMQQQMMQQQAMYGNGYPPNMNPLASQDPAMNFARYYTGPQAPNPVGGIAMMPAGYPPMMPQQPIMPISYQQPAPYQQPMPIPTQPQVSPAVQQVQQLIKALRESPYPATREWAGQQLTSFDWRVHPQIVPTLVQSASQDPAASVRAGCISCLGRAQAAVEPVFTMLHTLRNDIDPRVRQEVEQALVRLGQTQQP